MPSAHRTNQHTRRRDRIVSGKSGTHDIITNSASIAGRAGKVQRDRANGKEPVHLVLIALAGSIDHEIHKLTYHRDVAARIAGFDQCLDCIRELDNESVIQTLNRQFRPKPIENGWRRRNGVGKRSTALTWRGEPRRISCSSAQNSELGSNPEVSLSAVEKL